MININKISKIGLGTGKLASFGSSVSQSECDLLLRGALENNINVIDTADTYGSGDAEKMIGKSINGYRTDFFIITKAGFPYMSLPGFMSPLNQIGKKVIQKINNNKNFSKNYLVSSLYRSLKRLNTDIVDAFVLHEPYSTEILDESWEALDIIKNKGMARYVGVSTVDSNVVSAGIESKRIEIVETPISLLNNNNSFKTLTYCNNADIPIIANQVLLNYNRLKAEKQAIVGEVLSNYKCKNTELIKIFIEYACSRSGVKSAVVGTKNLGHLIDNSKPISCSVDLENLYKAIKSINL